MTDETSKELPVPKDSGAVILSKPRLIELGGEREIATSGWRDELAIDYIRRKARTKAVSVGELARVFYGGSTIPAKKRVRAHLPAVTIAMAKDRQEILITETEGRYNRVSAVKIFDPKVPADVESAKEKVEKMHKRKQLSAAHFQLIWATLEEYVDGEIEPEPEAA